MFNLFGKKEDKSFFLELDESKASQPSQAETEKTAQPAQAAATEEKKPEPAQKTSVKKAKAAKKAEVKASPTVAAAAPSLPASISAKIEPKEVNFATKHLIGQSMPRHRPGPSLNPFKEMARQVKVPRA